MTLQRLRRWRQRNSSPWRVELNGLGYMVDNTGSPA